MEQFSVINVRLFKILVVALLIFSDNHCQVETLDPITDFIVGVVSIAWMAFYNYMPKYCVSGWINLNAEGLGRDLREKLHGQHLVSDVVMKALTAHMTTDIPTRALVLSFHGPSGVGKNFVSNIIARNIYKEGTESNHYHLFLATLHFPHPTQIDRYKNELRQYIQSTVSACPKSMFVFDEIDSMPNGLFDVIRPFVDYHAKVDGVDYRKSIFIFLSTTAGEQLKQRTLQHHRAGRVREYITLKEMEEIINKEAFTEKGGLRHSSLIEKNLISAFVPFLPLERKHVKQCVGDELKKRGFPRTKRIITEVADELFYYTPDDLKLYSNSGCKRVPEKVDLIMLDGA